MRISTKLSLAVGATTFVCVGASGVLGARTDVELFEADVQRDQRAMGVAIARAIEHVGARDGAERARALVGDLNGREPNVEIRWLEDARPPDLRAPTSEILRLNADPEMTSNFPVELTPGTPSTLRLVETLRGEAEIVRTAYLHAGLTAILAALLSTLVMSLLGAVLVARPLRALGFLARRLGGGDLGARAKLGGSDEIGVLAREMNAMGAQLEDTQAKLDEASAARVTVLEELRHADRLRVLGELASEFAHQIGTPLAAVRTRAQLLALGEVGSGESPKLGQAIVHDVDRVAESVRQMLDFSRRSAGPREDVDVSVWADRVLDVLRPLTARRQLGLELRAPREAIHASIASIEMQQVLTNLIVNGLQASHDGGRVVVEVRRDADTVVIVVTDDGAGIEEAALPHVFEPYFTTKRVGEGTGLGLSVAHGIVREHGGTIEIESAVGVGTSVSVRLPAGPAPRDRGAADGKASWKARLRATGPAHGTK